MSKTRLDNTSKDNEFDLEEYLEKKAREKTNVSEESKKPSFKRNFIAVALFVAFFTIWIKLGNIPLFFSFDSNDVVQTVTNPSNSIFVPTPLIPAVAPPIQNLDYENFEGEYLDYLQQLNEQNLNVFSTSAVQAFYSSGVSIQYIQDLEVANLLNDFSYTAIVALYSSGVTITYLKEMTESGFLGDFSYTAIIGLYSANVPVNYLDQMDKTDVLDLFSYIGIIGLYTSNVPVSFLEELENRDLLDDMNYTDVINAYNIDN